ncbi:hypothetical protein [Campylobacter rectus]
MRSGVKFTQREIKKHARVRGDEVDKFMRLGREACIYALQI